MTTPNLPNLHWDFLIRWEIFVTQRTREMSSVLLKDNDSLAPAERGARERRQQAHWWLHCRSDFYVHYSVTNIMQTVQS